MTAAHAAGIAKSQGHGRANSRATSGPTTAITTGIELTARISGLRSGKHARSLSQGDVSAGAKSTIAKATARAAATLATPTANPSKIAHTGHQEAGGAGRRRAGGSGSSLIVGHCAMRSTSRLTRRDAPRNIATKPSHFCRVPLATDDGSHCGCPAVPQGTVAGRAARGDSHLDCRTPVLGAELRVDARSCRLFRGNDRASGRAGCGQETAACSSSTIFFSTAGLHFCSAYDTGQMSPSSRLAESWNSRVE